MSMSNIPKIKKDTKTISVILPLEMYEAIEKVCEEEERNVSYIVRKAIQEYLDK